MSPKHSQKGGKPVAIAALKGKKGTPVKKGKGIMQGAMKNNNKQAVVKAVTAKASAGRQVSVFET